MPLSRRDFARLLAVSGTSALLPQVVRADDGGWGEARRLLARTPLPAAPPAPDEAYWRAVRARFLVPPRVGFLNAANLCPMPLPVVEAIEANMRRYEANPSPEVRATLMAGREEARTLVAAALRVTPEEIVLTRNTTEGNNFVSSGLTLGPGDEVVVNADNHPSNLNAWRVKAARFGFTVVTVPAPAAHPGTDGYVDLFLRAFTPRTRVLAINYVSSNSGDLLPVAALCRAARERNVLSLVDSAQAFGVLDVDLGAVAPDFFTGSFHKWPCGPKEKGVLYVNRAVHDRIAPTIVGLYGGAVGLSRTFEAEGQRDDASIHAVVAALGFQAGIGRPAIETRARELSRRLMTGLQRIDGVQLYTDPAPDRSAAIVIFRPGTLDPRRLGEALARDHAIVVTTRPAGGSNPGIRVSPHFYNTADEIDRLLEAITGYMKTGV